MKTKLVITSNNAVTSCHGCVYYKEERDVASKCIRPDHEDTCLIDSNYGVHFGIYVLDNTEKEK